MLPGAYRWLVLYLGVAQAACGHTPTGVGQPATAAARTPDARGSGSLLLWEVRRDGRRVGYLHGSIHARTDDHAYEEPAVLEAFDASTGLIVEVDTTLLGPEAVTRLTEALGQYPDGDDVTRHISSELWAATETRARALGLQPETLRRFRPWLLALTLSNARMTNDGATIENGVEHSFLARAHPQRGAWKSVRALETAEEQLSAFSRLSRETQALMLRDALGEPEGLDRLLADAWRAGRTDQLETVVFRQADDPVYRRMYEAVFFDRNRRFADRLEPIFRDGVHFVVIGAGHLIGPRNVVDLLRQRGYTVEEQFIPIS